jgi:Tol biopolymer transport system component
LPAKNVENTKIGNSNVPVTQKKLDNKYNKSKLKKKIISLWFKKGVIIKMKIKQLIYLFTTLLSILAISFIVSAAEATDDITTITLVSVDSSGVQGNSYSSMPSISADGRYVAFESNASNLVDGDTNTFIDIFVHDLQTNLTTRLSVNTSGVEGNGNSFSSSISNDGRFVAFESNASNLVDGDTNTFTDVFLRDMQTNLTTRLSVNSSGVEGNGASKYPSMSGDGRYVVFYSQATNLDNFGMGGVFLHDTISHTTKLISIINEGTSLNGMSPSISEDGQYITFFSPTVSYKGEIYLYNRISNSNTPVAPVDFKQANDHYRRCQPKFSKNGQYIVYISLNNGIYDIYVYDRIKDTNERIPVTLDSYDYTGGMVPYISGDGRFVTFRSSSSNVVSGDTNENSDVFVYDFQNNRSTLVSVNSSGIQGNSGSTNPTISSDGRFVAFESYATNLVNGDSNGEKDIFVTPLVKTEKVFLPLVIR